MGYPRQIGAVTVLVARKIHAAGAAPKYKFIIN